MLGAYAYQGEISGVVVVEKDKTTFPNGGVGRKQIGEIHTAEM